MNLYIDTATSDRWKFGKGTPDEEQPHIVRLAWLLEAENTGPARESCHLIKLPQGMRMAGEAAHHTGIYDHLLNEERGFSLSGVLKEFSDALGHAHLVIAHSWAFHRQVLERSFRYLGWPAREWPDAACTMIKGAPIVRIPRMQPGGGYKWPSFEEACEQMLGTRLRVSRDPIEDGIGRVRAVRLFWAHIQQHQGS